MALWGNNDSVYSAGTVAVDLSTGIGTGAVGIVTWTSAGIRTGDFITVGTGATYGYAVISGFTSSTISLASTANFVSGLTTVPATSYNISQTPVYILDDSTYDPPQSKTTGFSTSPVFNAVFGVDQIEVGVAATTAFAVGHSGWVGIMTYIDNGGNLRVKHEVLVAGGILTTSDAGDDARFPDS